MTILEEEGTAREQILNLKLDDMSVKRFHQVFKKFVRVRYGTLSEKSNAMIEQFISLKIEDRDFYIIAFDDCNVSSIFDIIYVSLLLILHLLKFFCIIFLWIPSKLLKFRCIFMTQSSLW